VRIPCLRAGTLLLLEYSPLREMKNASGLTEVDSVRQCGDATRAGPAWGSLGKVWHFNAQYLIVLVEILRHARRDFFGLDDLGIVEAEVKRIGLFVYVQSHSLPLI
jgi:hypothetical protein